MYYERIHGYFNFDNIYDRMVDLAMDGAVFAEIGSFHGKSTVYMAEKIKLSGKDIKWFTIDHFEGTQDEHEQELLSLTGTLYETYLKNIEPVKEYIHTIREDSKEAHRHFADGSLDFLFIDGDHTYKGMRKDLELWYPKVKSGGYIGGHDYAEPTCGVKMAVDSYFLFDQTIIKDRTSWLKKIN